jgi:hypothetical protein
MATTAPGKKWNANASPNEDLNANHLDKAEVLPQLSDSIELQALGGGDAITHTQHTTSITEDKSHPPNPSKIPPEMIEELQELFRAIMKDDAAERDRPANIDRIAPGQRGSPYPLTTGHGSRIGPLDHEVLRNWTPLSPKHRGHEQGTRRGINPISGSTEEIYGTQGRWAQGMDDEPIRSRGSRNRNAENKPHGHLEVPYNYRPEQHKPVPRASSPRDHAESWVSREYETEASIRRAHNNRGYRNRIHRAQYKNKIEDSHSYKWAQNQSQDSAPSVPTNQRHYQPGVGPDPFQLGEWPKVPKQRYPRPRRTNRVLQSQLGAGQLPVLGHCAQGLNQVKQHLADKHGKESVLPPGGEDGDEKLFFKPMNNAEEIDYEAMISGSDLTVEQKEQIIGFLRSHPRATKETNTAVTQQSDPEEDSFLDCFCDPE